MTERHSRLALISDNDGFPVFPERLAQGVGDFANGRQRLNGIEDGRDQVCLPGSGQAQLVQRPGRGCGVARGPQLLERLALSRTHRLVDH